MRHSDYIELNRSFVEIPDGPAAEARLQELELLAYVSGASNEIDWDAILQLQRTVILGEPGSGKSEELRRRAAQLTASNRCAFFVDLRDLVGHRLCSILDRKGVLNSFRSWLKGDEPAWFFLDAVDESKLVHQNDFRVALENFSRDLESDAKARARVVLSSRISSWRPQEDLLLFDSLLGLEGRDEKEVVDSSIPRALDEDDITVHAFEDGSSAVHASDLHETKVLALTPLSIAQVETFVSGKGEDGRKFCEALVAKFLEPLSRRPLDVENLLRYWRDKHEFGTYMAMLDYSVDYALVEPSDDPAREILTPVQAREGSETLAAMVLLCRRRDMALSDESSDYLQPRLALSPKIADSEVKSLLDRALFDAPVYGCVRFHHRETEEYLAARWLERLTKNNLPVTALKNLFFEELSSGTLVLRQTLAAVAAWYACFGNHESERVREWLRRAEPELFFRASDPSQLPLEYRIAILDALIESYRGWQFTRIEVDRAALTRLAHPRMATYLASRTVDKEVSEDLRGRFFNMAGIARLPGLQESAMTVLLSEHESEYLKDDACDYLTAIGDTESLTRLAASLTEIRDPGSSLVASLLVALFPKFISRSDAVALLKRLTSIEEFSTSPQFSLVSHCRDRCDPEQALQFVAVFNDVLEDGPPWYREGKDRYRVGSRFAGLGDVLLQVLPNALNAQDFTDDQVMILAQAVWLVQYLSRFGKVHRRDQVDLKVLLATHERVRKWFLSHSIGIYRNAHDASDGAGSFFIRSLIEPILQHHDARWILDEIDGVDDGVALILLRIVETLWIESGYPRDIRRKARILVRQKRLDEHAHAPHFPGWPLRRWYMVLVRYRRTVGQKYWWSRRVWDAKERLRWWRNQWDLIMLLPKISRGDHKGALWFLVNELDEKDSSHLARTGWARIRNERGRLIEEAAKKGVIAYWPKFVPKLRHERRDGDASIDGGVIIGLTGIQEAITSSKLSFDGIGDDQVRQLTRYALNEINGFPEWFCRLVVTHPDPVREVVMSAVDYEWELPSERESVHGIAADLSYDTTGTYAALIEPVLEKLADVDPIHPAVLSQVLRLAFRDLSRTSEALRALAIARSHQYPVEALQHTYWISTLLQLDAASALDEIETALTGAADPEQYVIRLMSAIASDGRGNELVAAEPSYRAPDHLARLIQLCFKYLPPELDPQRPSGEVYTVTSTDDAVRFRDGLIAQLSSLKSDDADDALRNLLELPALRSRHDWIRHLVLQHQRETATTDPWREEDVRAFEEQHVSAPKNARDVFRLTCDRVQEIKDWVELGDDSPRRELNSSSNERDVRVWVARKLKEHSRGLYSVPEEHELASGKRQDIRIEAPSIPGHVVVEVKQVEGWSYSELQERLKNQLVGTYLRARNARFGIYLISYTAHSGKGSGCRDTATGDLLTFSETVESLQRHADELAENDEEIEQINVIGIDFVNC